MLAYKISNNDRVSLFMHSTLKVPTILPRTWCLPSSTRHPITTARKQGNQEASEEYKGCNWC